MRQIRHPLSGAIYELDDEGQIVVSRDGVDGRFTAEGRWLSGAVRTADPELCRWIASGNYGHSAAINRWARGTARTEEARRG
jgi:hypothetical protein